MLVVRTRNCALLFKIDSGCFVQEMDNVDVPFLWIWLIVGPKLWWNASVDVGFREPPVLDDTLLEICEY